MGKPQLILGCKILELILACVCIGLYSPTNQLGATEYSLHILMPAVFGSYIVIQLGILLAHLTKKLENHKKIGFMFAFIGFVLFLVVGSLAVDFYSRALRALQALTSLDPAGIHLDDALLKQATRIVNCGLAAGAVAIVDAIVFLVDMALSFKDAGFTT